MYTQFNYLYKICPVLAVLTYKWRFYIITNAFHIWHIYNVSPKLRYSTKLANNTCHTSSEHNDDSDAEQNKGDK